MKLYLSSYKFGDNPEKLTALSGKNKKIALVANALDCYSDLERRKKDIDSEINTLKSLGFDPEEVDLRKYFGNPGKLKEKMNEFGALWVHGGNTFVLRRAFAQSGLDKWLLSQKDNNELLYAGYSAGVCLLSPSLKGSDITDDPKVVPEGYKPEVIWDGLGLIDFAFAPHFESNHPESESVGREVVYYQREGVRFKALHDGEVIVMEI